MAIGTKERISQNEIPSMLTAQTVKAFAEGKQPRLSNRGEKIELRFLKQSKLMSQLLAKSWVEDPEGVGKKIGNIILNKDDNEQDFLDLISGKKPELFETCIFDEEELEIYAFKVDWNTFECSLDEHPQVGTNQKSPCYIITIPYPPKPSESNLKLDDEKFKQWLNSKVDIDDPNQQVTDLLPPIPYIPRFCC